MYLIDLVVDNLFWLSTDWHYTRIKLLIPSFLLFSYNQDGSSRNEFKPVSCFSSIFTQKQQIVRVGMKYILNIFQIYSPTFLFFLDLTTVKQSSSTLRLWHTCRTGNLNNTFSCHNDGRILECCKWAFVFLELAQSYAISYLPTLMNTQALRRI